MTKIIFLPFFAVVLGSSIALILRFKTLFGLKFLLSFSGAFLLSILFLDFFPEIFKTGKSNTGIFIMIGVIIQIILELFSKGAEHGHTQNKAYKSIPWILILSLSIHSILEGIPLNHLENLIWGIFIHKIPIAIIITILLWETKSPIFIKILALIFFSIMTPLGVIIEPYINKELINIIDPIVIGILLHISTTILFESGKGHAFNFGKLISILLGIIIAYYL